MIGPNYVRELEGVLMRCPKNSVGIIIVPSQSGFSFEMIRQAKSSKYNIILTDEINIFLDIIQIKINYEKPSFNFNLIFLFLLIFNTFLLSLILIK